MAEMFVIKGQMIDLHPNNEDWAKWVNSQKRVDNLTNDDGELRPKSELEALYQRYREKHQVKSTPIESPNILRLISEIKDNGFLESIIKACEEQIEANNNAARKAIFEEALQSLKEYKAIGGNIKEVLDQL